MSMNAREQKTIKLGGIAAAIIILVAYVIMPLVRKSAEAGNALAPRREMAAMVREKVQGRHALVKRRDVLAMRLGSLRGAAAAKPPDAPASEEDKPDGPDAAETPDTPVKAPASEEDKPGGPAAAEAPDAPVKASASEEDKPDGPAAAKKKEGDTTSVKKRGAPAAQSAMGVAAHLERAAKKAGMKIKRITPMRRTSQRGSWTHFKAVALQVNIEGDAGGLVKLLHEIERGNRFMRIDEIKLRRDLKKNTLDINFAVMAYEAV